MTRDNSNKLRAVFLAALMFLWLFAGTVAFAGGAAAVTVTNDNWDGAEVFQGQEVTIEDVGNQGESIQLREVTERQDDGDPQTTRTRSTRTVNEDGDVTFRTSNVPEGEFVLRNVALQQFLQADGSYDSLDDDAAEASHLVQTLETEFDDDEVRAGDDTELQFDSPERGSSINDGFTVNVSEANGDLDGEDLEELLIDGESNLTDADANVIGSSDIASDDDDVLQLFDVENFFEEDVTVPSDFDEGDYEIVFDVEDTTAEATADLTVLEGVDFEAEFDQGTYTETRGDIVEISGTVEGTDDTFNLTIGEIEEDGYEANVTVEANDDDEWTVLLNTRNAGLGNVDETDIGDDIDDMVGKVFGTAEDQGSIESVEETQDLEAVLEAGNYDIFTHEVGEERNEFGEFDVATMSLTERSTDDMTLWRAPEDVDADDIEDLDELNEAIEDGTVTQTETLTHRSGTGDLIIHQMDVSGVQGEGNNATALLNKSFNQGNISLEYEQTSPSANRRAFELNYTETKFEDDFEVLIDRDNDVVYAMVDITDLQLSRGSWEAGNQGPAAAIRNDDDEYEVSLNVSANYLNNFERDSPFTVGADEDDEIVSQSVDVEERELEFDTVDDEIRVPPSEDAEISGETNIAPGTEFDIRAQGSGDTAFLRTGEDTLVNEDGTFSNTLDFSDIEAETEFDASVRRQGFEDNAEQSGVVGELEGPVFVVSDLEPQDAEVDQGDLIDVSATITNEGDEDGTQTVSLTLDGDELDSQEVELDEGDDTVVEFTDVDTSDLEGTYEHGIATDDDSATGTLVVNVDEPETDDEEPPETDDEEPPETDDEEPPETDDEEPEPEDQVGFGAVVALVALLAAALLAARRNALN